MEFRYYQMPAGSPILALLGQKWVQNYGNDVDYLHFHNYLEIGFCYEGDGVMAFGEAKMRFSGREFTVIPPNYAHTTNSDLGTVSKWEYLFIDVEGFMKKFLNNPVKAEKMIQRIYMVITHHEIGKNFHHPDRNINVHGFHQRNGPVDHSGIFHLRHDPAGRIIMVGIFTCLFHKHTVKFLLQNNVRNDSFCSHLIYIGMACGVQNIMTAKPKKICKKCLIIISSDLPHPFFKKRLLPSHDASQSRTG